MGGGLRRAPRRRRRSGAELTIDTCRGHEQRGHRLAVVVHADEFRWLNTATVVPASTGADDAIFRPTLTIGGRHTSLLVDQISTVDRNRLGRRVGRLSETEMRALEESLGVYLGLV